ncbi:MAG: redoxin domain-containing protein [Gallionellaceae bacterium]|jgi:peroxiredoxin
MKYIFLFSMGFFAACCQPAIAADTLKLPDTEVNVRTYDGNELTLYQYPAKGTGLVIWINGHSWDEREIQAARNLASAGIEVWLIDFSEALMQTSGSSLMRNMDAEYVADIIDAAHQQTGKKVIVMAQSFAAIPALGGATLWQQRKIHHGKLSGAVLFSPDLSTALPALGKDPEYLPIARATNIPVMIYQGSLHGPVHQFKRLHEQLSSNNPNVFFKLLPGVTSIFFQDQNSDEAINLLNVLPAKIGEMFKFFDMLTIREAKAVYVPPKNKSNIRPDIKLTPYTGKVAPLAIDLLDSSGKRHLLGDYRGKVTVVNFWATWCPPCVEEIPSLNRLREQMQGEPFELITINYAESAKTIRDFMQRVSVQFPVLLDPNGKVSQQWNVIGFPSTFVIGPDGNIRYGVNAAIHWDSEEVVNALKALNR